MRVAVQSVAGACTDRWWVAGGLSLSLSIPLSLSLSLSLSYTHTHSLSLTHSHTHTHTHTHTHRRESFMKFTGIGGADSQDEDTRTVAPISGNTLRS